MNRHPTVYDHKGKAIRLGAAGNFDPMDPKFLMTSGVIVAGTVGLLIFFGKKKKRKK